MHVTVELDAEIALGRCNRCGIRVRVLPCDVLPHKTYGLGVIEQEIADYSRGDRSLRQVAWSQFGERTPAYTTLHGWTEGLGAHALGRPGGDLSGAPISRFIGDAEPRVPEVANAMDVDEQPDPRRYRSEPRCDRLAAVIQTLTVVTVIAGLPHPHAMVECRRLALAWSSTSVLEFPSRLSCTSFEHVDRSESPRSRSSSRKSRDQCPTRTRSPPGASNSSPP